MLEATSTDNKILETWEDLGTTSDFSPSSDRVIDNVLNEDPVEDEAEYLHNSDGLDGDSLDEGLGDISSYGNAESPIPNNYNSDISEQAIINSAKKPNQEEDELKSSSIITCERERRPSRIAYETPL